MSRAHEGNGIKCMSKKSYRPNAKSCFLVAFRLRAKLKILKMEFLEPVPDERVSIRRREAVQPPGASQGHGELLALTGDCAAWED